MVLGVLSLAGVIAAAFAGLMVMQRSLYHCAICLLVVLFQSAVFFYFAGAPLLAFLQVMIYAGAVMVLIVILVMAAPSRSGSAWSRLFLPRPLAIASIVALCAEAVFAVAQSPASASASGSVLQPAIAAVLFGPYAVATEAVTLLLLIAALAITQLEAAG